MSRYMATVMGDAVAMADAAIEIKAQGWQRAGAVAFDVTNSSDEPATFSVEAKGAKLHRQPAVSWTNCASSVRPSPPTIPESAWPKIPAV
jgi:hypothetical protein